MSLVLEDSDSVAARKEPVRLRYYALLFAGVLWGFVFGLGYLRVYFDIGLIKYGSILGLLAAAIATVAVVVSRLGRVLTTKEVLRLTALSFIAHWGQDVLFPFVYRWRVRGETDFDLLVIVVTVGTAFLLTWIALAATNGVIGEHIRKPPVAKLCVAAVRDR